MGRNPNARGGVEPPVVDRPLDDAELVERAKRGDLRAWETIVRGYQGLAFRTAYLLSGNAADAEEAVQDGFVKAYRALGRFRRGAPLRPWLLRIVKPEGFIWKDGSIGTSERLRVELPEMSFDVSGRHTVYAEFDYAVGSG